MLRPSQHLSMLAANIVGPTFGEQPNERSQYALAGKGHC
ncbi:hypothetical protein PLANPX_5330 [Lacipirellula parvula]|uniref:Uncharacterized protein n=1 Tax=Lacipirellula parvula TaxID=2650471 RepID=A0A5K7XGZ9_9BACT|nr:hypothetical protein PLANPX_5330 [Lacipirellula parvula]